MSVCKHLPNGTTLVKWEMGGFGEKYRAATCGDQWCSDLFTTNLDGNPQCLLKFRPPIDRVAYTDDHPRLDYSGTRDHVELLFVDDKPKVEMTVWMEDENGEMVVPKAGGTTKAAKLNVQAIKRLFTTSIVFLCCEIKKSACGQIDRSSAEQQGAIRMVDHSTPPLEFEWECGFVRNGNDADRGTHESRVIAVRGTEQKFVFKATCHLAEIWIKNAGVESQELFHYEAWVENEKRHETYKTEGIARLFGDEKTRLQCIDGGSSSVEHAFFANGRARLRLNFRPLRPSTAVLQFETGSVDQKERLGAFLDAHFNDQKYGDIRVVAKGGVEFHVSKLLLCSQSEVFERMFEREDTKESIERKIEMDDLEPPVVEAMLRWIYMGEIEGLKEMDSALYVVADRYHLVGLQNACIESMSANFSSETIFEYLQLAFTYDRLPAFKQIAVAYAARNLAAITHLESWPAFVAAHLDIVNEVIRQALSKS